MLSQTPLKAIFRLLSLAILVCGCGRFTDENPQGDSGRVKNDSGDKPTTVAEERSLEDTTPMESISDCSSEDSSRMTGKVRKQRKARKPVKERLSFDRFIEFPGENNWNGKPMVQQVEISRKTFLAFPDTLSKLAVERYKGYEDYFPRVIACNFEEGTSLESVMYPPKLVFRFQVFEDGNAEKPYLVRDVTIRRNGQNEPYSE